MQKTSIFLQDILTFAFFNKLIKPTCLLQISAEVAFPTCSYEKQP